MEERLEDDRLLDPRLTLARPLRLDEALLRLLPRPDDALLRSVKRPWLSRAWPRPDDDLDDDDFEDDERDELLRDAMMLLLEWLGLPWRLRSDDATPPNLGMPRVRTVGRCIASM